MINFSYARQQTNSRKFTTKPSHAESLCELRIKINSKENLAGKSREIPHITQMALTVNTLALITAPYTVGTSIETCNTGSQPGESTTRPPTLKLKALNHSCYPTMLQVCILTISKGRLASYEFINFYQKYRSRASYSFSEVNFKAFHPTNVRSTHKQQGVQAHINEKNHVQNHQSVLQTWPDASPV